VYLREWNLDAHDTTSVTMSCELGDDWPFGGTAEQVLTLQEGRLECVLCVTAGNAAMPCTLGWHPWFVKPVSDSLHFEHMAQRLPSGIPSGHFVAPKRRPWDDCFCGPTGPLQLRYPQLTITIESDCDFWTVYDEPEHATCVEPQSGPPDEFNQVPLVLNAGESLRRIMVVSWSK
jgi:aldose 1-epimerase